MALEWIDANEYVFEPGPIDVHAHPWVFDSLTADDFTRDGSEGKAGLQTYTETALASGLVALLAMPNEQLRLIDRDDPATTVLEQYPIANLDRVRAMQSAVSHEAVIPTGLILGVDPSQMLRGNQHKVRESVVRDDFIDAGAECVALKLYCDETTGGNNVGLTQATTLSRIWHETHPEKPVIMHLENENVGKALQQIAGLPDGRDIPIHIAHVSSRDELEAVIAAKEAGMNVTCEVTPHHLFVDASAVDEVGGYACMKPMLKSRQDMDFLWANLPYIDIIASDCAPHRATDKEAAKPAFGVTNHSVMLPLLFGAVAEDKLTLEDVYQKLVVNPRHRFNLPLDDGSSTSFYLGPTTGYWTAGDREQMLKVRYGQNLFARLNRHFHLLGQVTDVQTGVSRLNEVVRPSYTHLIRPALVAAVPLEGVDG